MTYCYPVWTAAARATVHHLTHHTIRHAALAAVRIVCVAVPGLLATPSPASAPAAPVVLPPPMLPWPDDGEVPWGWGPEDMPGFAGPVPEAVGEPWGVAVLGLGMVVLGWVRRG